jgi:biopolymer transport protein ExbD
MQTNSQEQDTITGINVTPLVDVILVLLTIFMVTAPMLRRRALHVQIPKAVNSERVATQALRVELDAKRKLWLDGKPMILADLIRELTIRSEREPAVRVSLAADEAIPYGDVVVLLDELRASGIKRVGLEVRR